MASRSSARVSVADVDIDVVDVRHAAETILRHRQVPGYRYVVTPNAQHLVHIAEGPASLAEIYRHAFLCVNDSRVVSRFFALLFRSALPICPGSDMTVAILEQLNQHGDAISIIGMNKRYLSRLHQIYPRLVIHHYNPPMGFMEVPAEVAKCLQFLIHSPASIAFLAVGFPRQEMLAARLGAVAGAKGTALCIGASLDFIVGAQIRAPAFIRKAGLEWAFRLLRDPRRMARRYLIDSPRIFYYMWKYRAETRASL